MAESRHPNQPHFDEIMAQLRVDMEQLSATMAQLESSVEMHHKAQIVADALGCKPPPVPPELEGWL